MLSSVPHKPASMAAQCQVAADSTELPEGLPAILTVSTDWAAGSSEELEGSSPVSERSVQNQLSGTHAYRVQRPRRGLGWVLRQLQRKQNQQQRPSDVSGSGLVSGSSYDSLCSLDQQYCCDTTPAQCQQQGCQQHRAQWEHADTLQQQTHPTQVQQQCMGPEQQQASAADQSSSGTTASSGISKGLLQRAVKAVLRPVVRAVIGAVRVVSSVAGPQGPGNNDNSMEERIINVLTSLPFFAVGLHGLRNRRCPRGRHYAFSFLVLGAVASGYHGADRSSWLRPVMRKLDYYTICYTSTVLRRAAHISLPNVVKAAAVLIAPFKPTVVTGLNLALVEGKYLKHALQHSHLRSSFKTHLGSAAVGMVCFAYEDVATEAGWPPVLHSLWHCLSALAMGCVHGLLEHLELARLVV